jgi:hypothetical protein
MTSIWIWEEFVGDVEDLERMHHRLRSSRSTVSGSAVAQLYPYSTNTYKEALSSINAKIRLMQGANDESKGREQILLADHLLQCCLEMIGPQ